MNSPHFWRATSAEKKRGKFKIVWTKNEQYQISNLFFALVATKLPKSISFDNDLIYTLLYLTTASSYYL